MQCKGILCSLDDLPRNTAKQRSEDAHFRKKLIRSGYLQLQESVYIRNHAQSSATEIQAVKQAAPADGTIYALDLPLSEFERMQTISGEAFDFHLFSDDFLLL